MLCLLLIFAGTLAGAVGSVPRAALAAPAVDSGMAARPFPGPGLHLTSPGVPAGLRTAVHRSLALSPATPATSAGYSQSAELTANPGGPGASFGYAVALSTDGATAVVAVPATNATSGEVYVFTHSNGAWSQTAVLSDLTLSLPSSFGTALALSAGGTTALVGAKDAGLGGAAVVFQHDDQLEHRRRLCVYPKRGELVPDHRTDCR